VVGRHEPSQLVGSDWKERDVKDPVTGSRSLEVTTTAEARVTGEIDGPSSGLDDEGGPQSMVAIRICCSFEACSA
jgi:hypothetical protein